MIRIDLLGHGGSEKPSGGYEIPEQADAVAAALDQLASRARSSSATRWASTVATALAERASQLVDRLVNLDEGPSDGFLLASFLAKLSYVPVLGEAIWRLAPELVVKNGYSEAFAPDFDLDSAFRTPTRSSTTTTR